MLFDLMLNHQIISCIVQKCELMSYLLLKILKGALHQREQYINKLCLMRRKNKTKLIDEIKYSRCKYLYPVIFYVNEFIYKCFNVSSDLPNKLLLNPL